jgi:gamma-glutamyltranspeptidase/glutathione hydrolase
VAATAHPLATRAAADVLQGGGRAADAAIAANAVLAVVHPHACGPGGDFSALVLDAGAVSCLEGMGRSGAGASIERVRACGLSAVPPVGAMAVSVPGCADAWGALLARHGRRQLGDLLRPAIALAENGFPCGDLLASRIRETRSRIDDPEWHRIFVPDGRIPNPGDRVRQPDLARTMERVAREGPRTLYEGDLAERIVRHVEAGGGFLAIGDLASHVSRWPVPLARPYGAGVVHVPPPPSQGVALLSALARLSARDRARVPRGPAGALERLLRTAGAGARERDRYLGDPDHTEVPVERLLADAARDSSVAPRQGVGSPGRLGSRVPVDTTGLVVADVEGSVVALLQSLALPFGAGIVPPGTGIVLHSRGARFSLDPTAPAALGPGRRPFHTLMPVLVTGAGGTLWASTASGGLAQLETQLQLVTAMLDRGLDPQTAIDAPRFRRAAGAAPGAPDEVWLEGPLGACAPTLRRQGYHVVPGPARDPATGFAHALARSGVGVELPFLGGADPRGEGLALGE